MSNILTRALVALLFAVCGATRAHAEPDARGTIQNGLSYLTRATLSWKEAHNCASCHHAPLMLWSCNEAVKKGFDVDRGAVDMVRNWLQSDKNEARLIAQKDPPDFYVFSLGSAYTTLGLAAGPRDEVNNTVITRFRDHYVDKQESDGSFTMNGKFPGTPPILEGGASATILACLALTALPVVEPAHVAMLQKTEAWLSVPAPEPTQQELSLRLLLAARMGECEAAATDAAALLALQAPDGSWSQTPELPGDAYATGQALLALMNAGMRASEPPIAEAIAFLARTQAADGSWPMQTRNNMKGTPEKPIVHNLEPITAAGSAWAVLGLLATR